MSITRRRFLRAGAVTVAAAGAHASLNVLAAERPQRAGAAAPSGGAHAGASHSLMTKAMFSPHLNTTFLIRPQGGKPAAVELVELRDTGPKQQGGGRECFRLVFRGAAHRPLGQETYRVEHRALGEFDLFLVPVRVGAHGQAYESIINHARL